MMMLMVTNNDDNNNNNDDDDDNCNNANINNNNNRLHEAMRWDTWPDSTILRDKLYGNLKELRRTAAFMRATGISI